MSSLSSQLHQLRSLDAAQLTGHHRKQPSYLFTPRQAAAQTLGDIRAIGHNGFLALTPKDPQKAEVWSELEESLFDEAAKQTDRTLLDESANQRLDERLETLLRLLGPSLLSRPCGQVLEWLIRRFRIHEFNVRAILGLFLPYHEIPQFAQMLQLLNIEEDVVLSALSAVKSTQGTLPRHTLVTFMTKSTDMLRFIATLLPLYLSAGASYRNLVAFWMATLTAFVEHRRELSPGEMAVLLPAVLDALKRGGEDNQLAGFLVIARLALKVSFTQDALNTLVVRLAQSRNASARGLEEASTENDEAMLGTLAILLAEQEEVSRWPDKATVALLQIPGVESLISRMASACDMTKLLRPLARSLASGAAQGGAQHARVLAHLLHELGNDDVVRIAAEGLLSTALSDLDASSHCIPLLSIIYQRSPSIYEEACSKQLQMGSEADVKTVMAQVIGVSSASSSQLALLHIVQNENGGILPAGTSSDSKMLQIAALQHMLADPHASVDAIRPQLALHLRDADPEVTKILLQSPNMVEKCEPLAMIDVAADIFGRPDASKALISAYARFFSGCLSNWKSEYADAIVFRVLWPKLLVTKSGRKTSLAVYRCIQTSGEGQSSLLTGLEQPVEPFPAHNAKVATTLARNMLSLPDKLELRLETFRKQLKCPGPASLLARWVLVELCRQDIQAMSPSILGDFLLDFAEEGMSVGVSVTSLVVTEDVMDAIFAKPGSRKTVERLNAHLLVATFDCLRRPKEDIPWLRSNEDTVAGAASFRKSAGLAYQLARATTDQSTAGLLMQSLFRTLGGDGPLFLLTGAVRDDWSLSLRVLALQDASIILRKSSADPTSMFIALIPLLRDNDKRFRQAAVGLLRVIQAAVSGAVSNTPADLYGTGLEVLSLNQEEAHAYLQLLLERGEEIMLHQEGLSSVHQALEGPLKRSVLLLMLSHAAATSDPARSLEILEAISRMTSHHRLAASVSILQSLDASARKLPIAKKERYIELVFGAFAKCGKRVEGSAIEALKILEHILRGNGDAEVQRQAILALRDLYPHLPSNFRLDFLSAAIETLASDLSGASSDLKLCALEAMRDIPTVKLYLDAFAGGNVSAESSRHSTKRSRTTATEQGLPNPDAIATSLDLVNVADGKSAELSTLIAPLFALVARLMDLVNQTEVSFAAQAAVKLISSILAKVDDPASLANVVRADVIVNLLKDTSSLSLARSALLLISQLTDLVSTQIIPHIMPIFTFVGHNLLSRDDAASLRVIEQTIDSIVPSLVRSSRPSAINRNSLVAALRDVMTIFASASVHVPLHKRTTMYSRLASALGAYDFLGPLCMLLADQQANKLAKVDVKSNQARDLLDTPLAVLAAFGPRYQLTALGQMVDEVRCQTVAADKRTETPFLDGSTGKIAPLRKRVAALVAMLHFAVSSKHLKSKCDSSRAQGLQDPDVGVQELAKKLILAMSPETVSSMLQPGEMEEFSLRLRAVLQSLITLTTATVFSDIIFWLADSSSLVVLLNALALLRFQLPSVKPAHRRDVSPAINATLRRISALLSKAESSNAKQSPEILQTLAIIARSATSEEYALLSQLMRVMFEMGKRADLHHRVAHELLMALAVMPSSLGPRMLAQVSDTVALALRFIPSTEAAGQDNEAAAHNLVAKLVEALPSFVGPHLASVLEKICTTRISAPHSACSQSRDRLTMIISRHVPPASIVPTLEKVWPSLPKADIPAIIAFVSLLSRTIRPMKPESMLAVHKTLFRLFMMIFDYRRLHKDGASAEDIAAVEKATVVAFLQMTLKLSDKSFRPLFLRAVDWALVDMSSAEQDAERLDRAIALFRLLDRMLTQLKEVAAPYFAFVLDPVLEFLERSTTDTTFPLELWNLVSSSLTHALLHGAEEYWTATRLQRFIAPCVDQLRAASRLGPSNVSSVAGPLIVQLAVTSTEHETVLKAVNTAVLGRMRDDADETAQIAAVRTLEAIWQSVGDAMSTHVPETLPIILECLDGEAAVERATRSLVQTMEATLGESLLEAV